MIADTISFRSGCLTVRSPRVSQPVRLTLCGDFHTAPDDERGIPYQDFSARMAQYGPKDCQCIADAVNGAAENGCDAVLMLGDLLNFPSEKGVELLHTIIASSKVPCHYVAGNHDWHYEGTAGTDMDLRSQWIESRLKPLYGGHNPLMYSVKIKGLKIILVDNSVYEILPEQLDFLKNELNEGIPTVLGVHIPLYIPGRDPVDFGCGHPEWGAANDKSWQTERREIWRERHTETTFEFCRTAFSAENLLGIFAGHTHTESLDCHGGKFEYVVPYRRPVQAEILPA